MSPSFNLRGRGGAKRSGTGNSGCGYSGFFKECSSLQGWIPFRQLGALRRTILDSAFFWQNAKYPTILSSANSAKGEEKFFRLTRQTNSTGLACMANGRRMNRFNNRRSENLKRFETRLPGSLALLELHSFHSPCTASANSVITSARPFLRTSWVSDRKHRSHQK